MTVLLKMTGTVFGIYFQATYSGLEQSQQSAERSSWEKMNNRSSVDDRSKKHNL